MNWKQIAFLLLTGCAAWAQNITTVAGNSSWGLVYNVKLDAAGNMYVADQTKHQVYKVDPRGTVTVIAGTGRAGYSGDGGQATAAQLNAPSDAIPAPDGSVYIADTSNDRIRKIAPNGIITTIAGTSPAGFAGDGGAATAARLNGPFALLLDSAGNLYFTDYLNYRVRRISPSGTITTIAGSGRLSLSGDGGPATAADGAPMWMAFGPDGSLYLTDDGDARFFGNSRVRRVAPNGTISTVAGTGVDGFSGDGGQARSAQFRSVGGVAVDSNGNIFISDPLNGRIRRVDPNTGIITTFAGTGTAGAGGDGGPAIQAQLNLPFGMTTDPQGNVYVADRNNLKIRRIDAVAFEAVPQFQSQDVRTLGTAVSSVSPGALVTIDGRNLSSGVTGLVTAPTLPLPGSLSGSFVTMDGIRAPVYSVANNGGLEQLIVQAPWELAGRGAVAVVVNNGRAASAQVSVTVKGVQPSLILLDGVQAAALHGDGTLVHAMSGATAGESILLLGRALGAVDPAPANGAADVDARLLSAPSVTIGGSPAEVTSAGLVAGFVGVYQMTVIVPQVGAGMAEVTLSVDGTSAVPARLAVK